ncbi:MAG: hypothetical protein GY869_07635 [Planctomycetes bacterium]|nr:hypothetical protein [Planctomycetota bacterium]
MNQTTETTKPAENKKTKTTQKSVIISMLKKRKRVSLTEIVDAIHTEFPKKSTKFTRDDTGYMISILVDAGCLNRDGEYYFGLAKADRPKVKPAKVDKPKVVKTDQPADKPKADQPAPKAKKAKIKMAATPKDIPTKTEPEKN